MEIRMIKLIASDLDGTLLQNGAQELTPRAIDLVRKLTEKGIYFVAASGRQYANERRLFAPVRDDISYIAENGSVCIHKGKVISRGIIEDDLAFRILREIKQADKFRSCRLQGGHLPDREQCPGFCGSDRECYEEYDRDRR